MYDKLTKADIEAMKSEIEHRVLVKRQELIEAVKEARAHGDLSENFEYYAAKREKNQNESRIAYLKRMINTATVIEDTAAVNEVGVDNVVTLQFEEQAMVRSLSLVTNVRGNSLEDRISIDSPIGRAILGRKLGERVYIKVNEDFGYHVIIQGIEKELSDKSNQINSF